MPTAHAGSIREGSDTADQRGAGNDEGERHAAEQRAAGRLGFRGSIHGGTLSVNDTMNSLRAHC
jgi:hypothetical protein